MPNTQHEPKFAHYQRLKILGQGGMGIVYLAEDTRLKRKVAIKCLKAERSSEQKASLRLQREATMLAQLSHPNVVQLYDIIEDGKQFALVMEHIDGQTLKTHLREHIVSLKQRLIWLQEIAEGLSAAHDKGLIHRDLKPENILINPQGIAKISDFGIAKSTLGEQTEFTQDGTLIGSYTALSPEQALGQPLDTKSDLFSFGILAFELLCGRHPFGGNDNHNVLVQNILHQPPIPANSLNPDLAPALLALLNSLLAKKANERPSSAGAVSQLLNQIIGQQLDDDTEPAFSETLDIPHYSMEELYSTSSKTGVAGNLQDIPVKVITKRTKVALVASLLLSLILTSAIYGYWQLKTAPSNLYVAVLPPVINEDSPISAGQQQLLLNTLSDALQQQVISSEGLYLISPRQVAASHGDYAQRAKALAADVLVEAVLQCQAQRCEVTLARIEAGDEKSTAVNRKTEERWMIRQQQHWPMVVDKQYLNIAGDFQQRLASLFPRFSSSQQGSQLKESDYQAFLKHRHEIINKEQNIAAQWQVLWPLQQQYRYYLPYYQLMSHLGRLLYDDSADDMYLVQLDELLNAAEQQLGPQLTLTFGRFEVALRRHNFDKAWQLLQQAESLGGDATQLLTYQGLLASFHGDYQQANAKYQQALELRPSSALWYRIANNYYYQGDNSSTLQALNALLALDTKDSNAQILMAQVYLLEGQLQEAIALYKQLITKSPQAVFYNNLGLAYELLGQYPQAEKEFTTALAISPINSSWRLNLADSFQLQGKKVTALEHYKQVIVLEQGKIDDWGAQLNLALAHMQMGNTARALQALHRSLRLAGDNAEVLFNAALIYSLADQWPVALSYVEQSLAQDFSLIWYRLPWFDGLCNVEAQAFNRLTADSQKKTTAIAVPRCSTL